MNHGLPDAGWDDRQRERGAQLLQGLAWGRFVESLGRPLAWSEGDGWSWLGQVVSGRGVRYLWLPYGPTARSAKTLGEALESVQAAAASLKVDFIRAEPVGIPKAAVAKTTWRPVESVEPEHSQLIDLTVGEDDLRHGLSSGHRNAINGAERRGLRLEYVTDPGRTDDFLRVIQLTAARRGFRPHPDAYYQAMLETLMPLGVATLGLATHEGQAVAAAIFLDYQGTRIYAHAGAAPAARKLQAAVPLVWGALTAARDGGLRQFDLWGVAPPEAPSDHPWAGFTAFKQAFGGQPVSYTGTWEWPVRPLRYAAIRFAKRLRG